MELCRTVLMHIVAILLLVSCGGGVASPDPYGALCPGGEARAVDGYRRLALIVGVGEYRSSRVPDLKGPPNDARRMYEMLTAKDGYNFPRQNVCLLLDDQATTENFRAAFQTALIDRAEPDDVAVVFFAGHGSQKRDSGGDEPDGWDETILLQDARYGDTHDLVDDELNELLVALHKKTRNVTAIFDSCNSGTAARSGSGLVSRFVAPAGSTASSGGGDGGFGIASADLEGLIVLTAASDGTPALERNGKGIFTDALLHTLGQASDRPVTYAQLARQVPPLMAAGSYQIPYFQGDLRRAVFGNRGRPQPRALEVVSTGEELALSGPTLPGIGVGAELRIYDGAVEGDAFRDPARAKADAVVVSTDGVSVHARITAVGEESGSVDPGDLAVLLRSADDFRKIRIRLRDGHGGMGPQRAAKLVRVLNSHSEVSQLVDIVMNGEDFELGLQDDGHLILRGPENRVRNVFSDDTEVPAVLWQHARQRALLQLQGEGGSEFTDNETLLVQLVPAATQSSCADGIWTQAPPNTNQIVPLCHAWNVKVTLSQDSPKPLLIGAALLSTDGAMFGLPRNGRTVRLRPGESVIFDEQETFRGTPPLDNLDRVMVFGTQERNPVAWHNLTQYAEPRATSPSGLAHTLERYLRPGLRTRGAIDTIDDSTWTLSSIGLRVEANSRFHAAAAGTGVQEREYTIPHFDIRPYLPDARQSPLRRVLEIADDLANAASADGVPYKQHDWSAASDAENLAQGIDCSRSIWFAFTRAGLPYNRGNRYLYTGLMVGDESLMRDEFDACPAAEPYQAGDVLVYRSASRGDGHTVMVIDADKRIAWGSMGWDGNAKASNYAIEPDVGVEYQRIKFKPDWKRWDRNDMELSACWRYRRFATEASASVGTAALATSCSAAACPLPRSGSPLQTSRDQDHEETLRERIF